eukprot:1486955-Karenia_brevis.AAC.1
MAEDRVEEKGDDCKSAVRVSQTQGASLAHTRMHGANRISWWEQTPQRLTLPETDPHPDPDPDPVPVGANF